MNTVSIDAEPTDGAIEAEPTDGVIEAEPTDGVIDAEPTDGVIEASNCMEVEATAKEQTDNCAEPENVPSDETTKNVSGYVK